MNQNYIPKVGDLIYVDTCLYVTHGMDDFIGGLCEVTTVRGADDNIRVEIKEDPGVSISWNHLKLEQEKLKKEFGTKRGHLRPDYRKEFNKL